MTVIPNDATGLAAGRPAAPDGNASFALRGRVVTMTPDDPDLPEGRILIAGGRIVGVYGPGQPFQPGFAGVPVIDTRGTIYPGLMDLHNHFAYNVLPLWPVPGLYENRAQWSDDRSYLSRVSVPVRALAAYTETARALVRYVEAKALAGGTTTGQGIRTRVHGGVRLFQGAMRNVEETGADLLPEAGTRVPTLRATQVEEFRTNLLNRSAAGGAYFYHLAEGTDQAALDTFQALEANGLLLPGLVGIHCLALGNHELSILASHGVRMVWSPFSNLLLYGRTLEPARLEESGVEFTIGSDWSPTGSKNLIRELKVARYVAGLGVGPGNLTSETLVRSITATAARTIGWQDQLGQLRAGLLADIVVIAGDSGSPYDHLIDAREADVSLVLVQGVPRYGDRELMEAVPIRRQQALEPWSVSGSSKAFMFEPTEALEGMSLLQAREVLREALSDLPSLRPRLLAQAQRLASMDLHAPEFTVELDNEYVPPDGLHPPAIEDVLEAPIVDSLALDPFEPDDAYWSTVGAQPNLPHELKERLRAGL